MSEPSPDAAGVEPSSTAGAPIVAELARTAFVTEESVYGVILVSGMIVVAGAHGGSSWSVFAAVVGTVLVFWAAHVYAGTVARHVVDRRGVASLRLAFRTSLRRSLGLLLAALIPSLILLLGATRAIDDTLAIWTALWAGVVVLSVLGYIAFQRRGAAWPMRIVGALGTAAFGVAMILLKALIH